MNTGKTDTTPVARIRTGRPLNERLVMARFIKEIEPTEVSYLVELTQSEVDVLMGIVSDFYDNPQRKVKMVYEFDESVSSLNERGMQVIEGLAKGLDNLVGGGVDYDYEEYWDMYPLEDIRYRKH